MNLLEYVKRNDVAKFEIVDKIIKPYTTYAEDLEAGIKRTGDFYFQVNKGCKNGKLKNEDVTQIKFLFIDFDMKLSPYAKDAENLTEDSQKRYMQYIETETQKAGLWPDFLVWSGRGVHAYFPIAEFDGAKIAELADIQRNIVKMFKYAGADQSVKDISRILRLPGTLNGKYETLNDVTAKKFPGSDYALEDFDNVQHRGVNAYAIERVINARKKMTKPVILEMRLQGHDYFYSILEQEGSRHLALRGYAQFLRQNYVSKEDCALILDKLAITVKDVKDHEVSEGEVVSIVEWVYGLEKNLHFYLWTPEGAHRLNELNEIAKKKIKYYDPYIDAIFSHIRKFGPAFYLGNKEFEGKQAGNFSATTNGKVLKMLNDIGILTTLVKGARFDGKNCATQYVLTSFKDAMSFVVDSVVAHFSKIAHLISFAFSKAWSASDYAKKFMMIGQAQISGDWSKIADNPKLFPEFKELLSNSSFLSKGKPCVLTEHPPLLAATS